MIFIISGHHGFHTPVDVQFANKNHLFSTLDANTKLVFYPSVITFSGLFPLVIIKAHDGVKLNSNLNKI